MARNSKTQTSLVIVVLLTLLISLACNLPIVTETQPEAEAQTNPQPETQEEVQVEESEQQQAPVEESQTQAQSEQGLTRQNPYPITAEVNTQYWDIKVLDFKRGEEAWQIVQQDDPDNLPPAAGQEYALALVEVRCKNPEAHSHDIGMSDLFITGDYLAAHTDINQYSPAPELFYIDIFAGETVEGWVDVFVPTDENNLILVFDHQDRVADEDIRTTRYIALEKDASISIPAENDQILPSESGTSKENPSAIGETIVTEDWEFSILESMRGENAQNYVINHSISEPGPEEGFELLVLKVRAKNINTEDIVRTLYLSDIRVIDLDAGNTNDLSDLRLLYNADQKEYWLNDLAFPGAELEKHVALYVPTDGGNYTLMFIPNGPSSGWRYLSIP